MIDRSELRDIPRVWEVDWMVPASEGGTPWAAYEWALRTARELGVAEVSIVAATFERLGDLGMTIGATAAGRLRTKPHSYRLGELQVRGVSTRGSWHARGVVLVAWARDEVLAEVESDRPAAVAAVATWPDGVATWRSVYEPQRIGQVRAEVEAEFDDAAPAPLDPRAADAIVAATHWVGPGGSTLGRDDREIIAGALLALRHAGVPVDVEALRALLMQQGWGGALISRVVELTERIARGERPRYIAFRLD